MSIYIGNNKYKEIYLGSNKISEIYLGSNKIYSSTTPGPTLDEVTIGTQTWLAKNLSIDDGLGSIYTETVNYGQGDVVEYYYNWNAAVRIANSISGWHLPSQAEWDTLVNAVGGSSIAGTILKSTYGWTRGKNGTDDYGFAGFPAGYRSSSALSNFGERAYFWTADAYSSTYAYNRYLYGNADVRASYFNKRNNYYSLRLVKDAT